MGTDTAGDRIVTGNIMVEKLVESIEDSGFDVGDVQCSTKKSLEESLKNVWNVNVIHEQIAHEEVNENNDYVFKVPNYNDGRKNEKLDWFDDEIESRVSAVPEKQLRDSDSGIFKLSLEELSIAEPANESSVKFHPEPEFHWNDGNITSNAISEPWSIDNPHYLDAQNVQNMEELTEEYDEDEEELPGDEKRLLARLPPRPPTPPRSKKRFPPFNISNLLCHKNPRTSLS